MDPHNEELSPAAQALLAQHRDARSPGEEQSSRVWDRVQHSLVGLPLGVEAGSGAQGAADAVNSAGQALSPGAELIATAGSAGTSPGLLGAAATKWTLGAILVTGGTTTALVAQDRLVDAYAPTEQVQPLQAPASPTTKSEPSAELVPGKTKLPLQPPLVPAPSGLSTKMDKPDRAPKASPGPSPLERTPALAAQLRALSDIDVLIRASEITRAHQEIRRFEQQYANSPFEGDLRVLKTVLSCRSGKSVSVSAVKRLLVDRRYRRYRARLARACQD